MRCRPTENNWRSGMRNWLYSRPTAEKSTLPASYTRSSMSADDEPIPLIWEDFVLWKTEALMQGNIRSACDRLDHRIRLRLFALKGDRDRLGCMRPRAKHEQMQLYLVLTWMRGWQE